MRLPVVVFMLLVCLFCGLTSCGDSRSAEQTDTPTADEAGQLKDGERRAQELVNFFGQAENAVFSMYIVYRPPEKEHLSFSLTAWSHSDGRLRIRMTKLGVDFLEGLINDAGDFTGVLVRDKKVIRGKLDDIMSKLKEKSDPKIAKEIEDASQNGAPLLAAIRLLRNEVCHGPINISDGKYSIGVNNGIETLYFDLPHDFSAAAILGSRRRDPVAEKVMFNKNNKEVLRLKYDKLKELDGLQRMCKFSLIIPNDDGQYTLILRELDVVKHIQEKNLYLDVPAYPEISIEDFGKKVVE